MKTINIKTIRIDGGTQSRVEINNEIVTEYAEAIKAGAEFPAVVVFNDGADNWLADGFHRFHGLNQAGLTSILADIRQGTLRDAKFYSWKANQEHGQRRTNGDKRKIVLEVLADDEAGKWSDNHIAKEFGFSPTFVGSLRKSLSTVDSEKPIERTYTTKHGTTATMRTEHIGSKVGLATNGVGDVIYKDGHPVKAPKPAVAQEPVPEPINEDKEAIAILSDENDRLNDRLAVAAMDATEEERALAEATITELRKENKMLIAMNKQLTISRDSFQNQVAELQKQINRQRREIDKALGTKTA